MADKSPTSLEDNLRNLIGNIDQEELSVVVDVVQTLGVTQIDDLKWVTQDDLKGKIKPVLARKMLSSYETANSSKSSPMSSSSKATTTTSTSLGSFSPGSPKYHNTDPNWPMQLHLPWEKLGTFMQNLLDMGKRLGPNAKRELTRTIVDAVREKTTRPTRQQLSVIAQRMVTKYTASLQDNLDGTIIGSGYDSLLNKLVSRNENLNRSESSPIGHKKFKKRSISPNSEDQSSEDQSSSSDAVPLRRDSYGCIDNEWMPKIIDTNNMQERKENLKRMQGTSEFDYDLIERDMKATYGLQRRDINEGLSMKMLKEEWPFLFRVKEMVAHAKQLTGIDIRIALGQAYTDKAVRMNRFFKQKPNSKCDLLYEEATRQSKQDKLKAWLVAVILCIIDHFGEREDSLFAVHATTSVDEIERATEKEAPMLAVLGDSVMAGKSYMLMCDGIVISGKMDSFIDAFSTLFAAFYVFNLEYPKGASTTLEFIQRCFVGINPDRGSKANQGKRKKTKMNAKVLSLINNLADFEWLPNP